MPGLQREDGGGLVTPTTSQKVTSLRSVQLGHAPGTLRTTPAVAAGLAEKPWSIAELVDRTKDFSLPVIKKTAIQAITDRVTEGE